MNVPSGPGATRLRPVVYQFGVSDWTLWGDAVPGNVQATVSPGAIATAGRLAGRRVEPSDRDLCRGSRRRRREREGGAEERRVPKPHFTTSSCSIIALSPCSSAWQWNTYRPV